MNNDALLRLALRLAALLLLLGSVGSLVLGRMPIALILTVACSLCYLAYCYVTAEDMPDDV